MSRLKKALKKLWLDESGQGATEYILILVVVGALIIAFRRPLIRIIEERTGEMGESLKNAISTISGG